MDLSVSGIILETNTINSAAIVRKYLSACPFIYFQHGDINTHPLFRLVCGWEWRASECIKITGSVKNTIAIQP